MFKNFILIFFFFFQFTNYASDYACQSANGELIACNSNLNEYMKRIYENSNYVISGRLTFVKKEAPKDYFVRGYFPVIMTTTTIYKQPNKQNMKFKDQVMISNAVLNYPGTKKNRGEVAEVISEQSYELIKEMKNFISSTENKGAKVEWALPSFIDLVDELTELSLLSPIYFESIHELEERDLVVFSDKEYIFFLQEKNGQMFLTSVKDRKRIYEFTNEIDSFLRTLN